MAPDTAHEAQPLAVGPFDLHQPLARGAMGEVWEGVLRSRGMPVAVKVLIDTSARDPWAREAFANEVLAAAGLTHPNIVSVLDHGTISDEVAQASAGRLPAGSPFLAMPLIRGQALHSLAGQLTWESLKDILLQLLSALAHSHSRGVIHRDLKPGNVLLEEAVDRQGRLRHRVCITDFGLAQALDRASNADRVVAGTPAYMAPEQLQGDWRDQGPWTDLYSLGCLGWAVSTGAPPFGRKRSFAEFCHDHFHMPPPPFQPLLDVPADFEAWLCRLLQKRPGDRYTRAADASWGLIGLGPPVAASGVAASAGRAPSPLGDAATGKPGAQGEKESDTLPQPGARPAPPPEVSTRVLPDGAAAAAASAPSDAPYSLPWTTPPLAADRNPIPRSWWRGADWPDPPRFEGVGLSLYDLRAVPIVNRERERTLLWEALKRVEDSGSVEVVILTGPEGSGKSRLAEWLCERGHEVGAATVLHAEHSLGESAGTGIGPMLTRYFRSAGLSRTEVEERLARSTYRADRQSEDERLAVAELICPATEADVQRGARVIQIQDAAERNVLVQRLIDRISTEEGGGDRTRPVVLWGDAAQWGPDLLAFVAQLLQTRRSIPTRVLVVLTVEEAALAAAPTEQRVIEAMQGQPGVSTIEVGPLDRDHQRMLVEDLLGMDSELVDLVTDRTAGNPLFAVHLVGDWVAKRVLEPGPRGFTLRAGVEVRLPDDLHAVWQSRAAQLLRGLPDAEALALEVAAFLGVKVDRSEWEAACSLARARPAQPILSRLISERLARVDRADGSWSFAHPMLREALERRAVEQGRGPRHHQAIARMLRERHSPGRGNGDRIAHHLLEAGQRVAALAWLLQAAQEADRSGEAAAAERLLERRERAMLRIPVAPDDPQWAEGWVLRAKVLRIMGRQAEALPWAERALALARTHGWTKIISLALHIKAILHYHRGSAPKAWRWLRQAEVLAESVGDRTLLGNIRRELGRILIERGRLDRATAVLESARSDFELAGDERGEAEALLLLGRVAKQGGELVPAHAHFERALDIFERTGTRNGMANCTNELGEVARLSGDLASALAYYEDALGRWEELGSDNSAIVRLNLGLVLQRHDRYAASREMIEEALSAFELTEHAAMIGIAHCTLLPCCAALHDWAAWDEHLNLGRWRLADTGYIDQDIAEAATEGARLALAAGEAERAQQALQLAAGQLRSLDRPEALRAVLALAESLG